MADTLDDTRLDYGTLGESLGFLLRLAQLRSFEEFFDGLGELDVRPGETTVLMMLDDNPGIRQGVLAQALMIKRAHMAKMVRAMEGDGLIRRTVPDDDKRAMELWLTQAGAGHVAALRGPFDAHERRSFDGLTPREATELKRLLRKYIGLHPKGETP